MIRFDTLREVVGVDVGINIVGEDLSLPVLETAERLNLELTAEGGQLSLPAATSFLDSSIRVPGNAEADAPALSNYENSTVVLTGVGATLSAPALSTISRARFEVHDGATYSLPSAITSYSGSGGMGINEQRDIFIAEGSGSLLDLSSLESLVTDFEGLGGLRQTIRASDGGQIDLSSLTTATGGGTGPNLGGPLQFLTDNGGTIDLSGLTSVQGLHSGVEIALFQGFVLTARSRDDR